MLIDSHCHLDFPALAADETGVLRRAREGGVDAMLTISTRQDSFAAVRAIAERHANVWCSVGVHPHEAHEQGQQSTAWLTAQAAHPRVIGIGETGLDYFYKHSPPDEQVASFRTHIAAARESGLPLIVHTRDADADTVSILREAYRAGPFTGLIHCFSSSLELAEKTMEIGFYISFSGIVTFKAAETVREVARRVPLDRLLIETDAPYLAPVPKRGRTNEPAFLAHTAARIAELKAIGMAELGQVTSDNFFRLFGKARRTAIAVEADHGS